MNWYHFWQNNSGGSFDKDKNISEHVLIEATTAEEANEIAMHIGIYFDGVDKEIDCECCGDRWTRVKESDKIEIGDMAPQQYMKDLVNRPWKSLTKHTTFHFTDG